MMYELLGVLALMMMVIPLVLVFFAFLVGLLDELLGTSFAETILNLMGDVMDLEVYTNLKGKTIKLGFFYMASLILVLTLFVVTFAGRL